MNRLVPTFAAASALMLAAACSTDAEDSVAEEAAQTSGAEETDYGYETYSEDNLADTMASNDPEMDGDATPAASGAMRTSSAPPTDGASPMPASAGDANAQSAAPDSEDREIMRLQVVLDRTGFGPGVIDGAMGMSTRNALEGFQEANSLDVTGEHDAATKEALARWDNIPATRMVTIPQGWSDTNFTDIPEDNAAKAELEKMGYSSLDEKLAERFHTTIDVLKELNRGGRPAGDRSTDGEQSAQGDNASGQGASFFRAGQQVRVPNIGGIGSHPAVSMIVTGSARSPRSASVRISPKSIASWSASRKIRSEPIKATSWWRFSR
ncbi:peptidoglycan-binding domain-containing protein [Erythrobacter sp.]|jgi:peptidoglycan hydrolase-like protein with peptidoglycan-binding domain|uniref:peptidoglycan-binding domain-containing protein n=1 Tax=Erythrobacter sp. TaxID=1042 RepID=UPI002E9F8B0F|nr:peptidoglycan-binding domain-containing protein [Erythrobacter sp.]